MQIPYICFFIKMQFFAYCLLPIAYCLLPIAQVGFKDKESQQKALSELTALCRGASRQRYAGGRADSVMPGGGPTALCPDSVMPSQRYALPRLEGVCPK